MMAKASGDFEERADPKVQLEQAIADAQDQHRRLVEQAANVVANQKQTEMQLNRAMEELEKVSSLHPPGAAHGRRRRRRGATRRRRGVQPDGRGVRQPPHRHREPGRGPQDA